jgi:outer membrane lipoprotein carrier protein
MKYYIKSFVCAVSIWMSGVSFLHAEKVGLSNNNIADVKAFQERISVLQTYQADFLQTTTSLNGKVLQSIKGKIFVSRPGKLYWKTHGPYEQEIVSNGKTIWLYDIDLEQVTIKNSSKKLVETPALLLSGDNIAIDKDFIVSSVFRNSQQVFTLIPRDTSQLFDSLDFVYDKNNLTSMVIKDASGQTTNVLFTQIKMNRPIDKKIYTFIVPENVDVIDAR